MAGTWSIKKIFRKSKSAKAVPYHLQLHRSITPAYGNRRVRPRTLPTELQLYIFELASYSDDERSSPLGDDIGLRGVKTSMTPKRDRKTLILIALLCKALKPWAYHHLYHHVQLDTLPSRTAFAKAMKRYVHLAKAVKSLSIVGYEECDEGESQTRKGLGTRGLFSLLRTLTELTELSFQGATIFSVFDFANGTNIEYLTLDSIVLIDHTITSRYYFCPLPALKSLTLRNCSFNADTAANWLSTNTLPRLEMLSMDANCCIVADHTAARVISACEPTKDLAQQLKFVEIVAAEIDNRPKENLNSNIVDFVPHCNKLNAISLPLENVTAAVIDSLPLSVQHVELGAKSEINCVTDTSACNVLSTTFLGLSRSSPAATPPYARSRASSVFGSSPNSPRYGSLSNSPFSLTGIVSPAVSRQVSPAVAAPLTELIALHLPQHWRKQAKQGAGNEFDWSLNRIERICAQREIRINYFEPDEQNSTSTAKSVVTKWEYLQQFEQNGYEMGYW